MIHTEVIEITDTRVCQPEVRVFTTVEGENPGGSIKDHMVFGELSDLRSRGLLPRGSKISEVSAGSTARSLSHYAMAFELECHLFIPEDSSPELCQQLEKNKARLHLLPRDVIYAKHDEFCFKHKSRALNQLWDRTMSRHYLSLGRRIRAAIGEVDYVVGTVGTGHSLKGVAAGLNAPHIVTAEPVPGFTVNGIRNLESERYGPHDPCKPSDFERRLFISSNHCFHYEKFDSARPLKTPPSFHLVLAAIQQLTNTQSPCRILALGASNSYL